MRMQFRRCGTLLQLLQLLLLAGAIAPVVAHAQGTIGAAGPLPDARAVLKRFAEASGAAKLLTVPGVHMKGTFEVPSQSLTGVLESYMDKSGRTMQVTNIAAIGAMIQGSDSSVAWALDPVQGPRLLQGRELAERRDEDDPRGMSRDPGFVLSAQSVLRTVVDGEPCVKLKLAWRSGRESTECYSEKTGLLVQVESVQASTIGDIPYVRTYSEYKTFDGVTLATKVLERAQGLEDVQHITEVRFEAIDPSVFTIPASVQALRKK